VALEYLHESGVYCRELKLDSLKVDSEGYLWLSEFEGAIMGDGEQENSSETAGGGNKNGNNFCELAEMTY
jgi:ligand-binding sensor domain-containing protein